MREPLQQRFGQTSTSRTRTAEVDAGLRAYMLSVYNYMASGILLTGIVAMITVSVPALREIFYQVTPEGQMAGYTLMGWVVLLAPLGLVFFLGAKMQSMSLTAAQATFWGFAGLLGLSLSSLFFLYTGESVARVFFITAATFGGLSLWGYTTKKDLTGWGSFLFMGVIGIIIASLVNIFLQSSMMQMMISVVAVLVFAGLTAYDTQKIKDTYFQMSGAGEQTVGKMAIMGALSLYLDFINLFIHLLYLFGQQR